MALIDNFTKEQLEQIVQESKSYREVITKLGYSTPNGNNHKTLKSRLQKYNISTDHFSFESTHLVERTEENVFCKNSTATQATLRRWFIKGNYVPYQCDCCGITEWQEKPLVLQLDHINGDNHDNRLENLHWLCPNCHSQTDTFCGKQLQKKHMTKQGITIKTEVKKYCVDCGKEISAAAERCPECAAKASRIVERPSAEELKQLLLSYNGNFVQVSKIFNVTDNTIRKWCKGYDLPFHTKDYKSVKENNPLNTGLSKSIQQLDKDTDVIINTFNTITEGAQWLLNNGITESNIKSIITNIGRVCNGKRKTAYNYRWQYQK